MGSIVLASGLRLAQEAGWTRMDIPLLLGTMFRDNRRSAAVIGWFLHVFNGLVFSLLYAAVFAGVGRAGWDIGLGLGAVHALFSGGALATLLLPAVHPRMGTAWTDAQETPLLEAPGFMFGNYGRRTAALHVALHLAYGAIVGAFAAGL